MSEKDTAHQLEIVKLEEEIRNSATKLEKTQEQLYDAENMTGRIQAQLAEALFEKYKLTTEVTTLKEENQKLKTKVERKRNKISDYVKELSSLTGMASQKKNIMENNVQGLTKEIE